MEFAKLSAPSLKDLFVQQLQGMILSDELPMGTQLPPERELAQQMQVSRAVVNGGLAELAQQGFLEVRPRQGTFVADYRRKGNLSTLIAIMEYQGGVLGKDEIRSILEVRRALEHLAAQRAIRYASDEALARLGDIVARIAAAQNNAQAAEAAFAFQHELGACGRQQHSAAHLLFVQGARYHPVAAFLPHVRHRRALPQHGNAVQLPVQAGHGRSGAVDRRVSGAGHRRQPADLRGTVKHALRRRPLKYR